jgi:hypothetical protein
LNTRSLRFSSRHFGRCRKQASLTLRVYADGMVAGALIGIFELSAPVRAHMTGRSHRAEHPRCPSFDALRLLSLRHHGFDGAVHEGELVVHRDVVEEVARIFERLFACGFPIASLRRVDHFDADDEASMAANNSSAFNFRCIQGSERLSHHALGLAIDLNPVQNPWLRAARVEPDAGRDYLDRSAVRLGMIVRPGPVVAAFEAEGWHWGADFAAEPDHHHFSKLPR